MEIQQIRDRVVQIGIIPVVRASSSAEARLAAEAVCAGGVRVVEITMTVPGAIQVIAELVRAMGNEILVGAGTCGVHRIAGAGYSDG